jgi:hypothetical protein
MEHILIKMLYNILITIHLNSSYSFIEVLSPFATDLHPPTVTCPPSLCLAPNGYKFYFKLGKVNDLRADVPDACPDGGRKQLPMFV